MEKQMKDISSELDILFNISKDLLCVFDLKGNLLKMNDSWSLVLGYPENELAAMNYLEFVYPDDLKTTFSLVQRLKQDEKISNYRNRMLTKTGEIKCFEWQICLQGDRIYASAMDISERISSEDRLKESEGRFQQIFENTPIGLFYYDNKGRIIECNDNFVSIIGSSREALVGLNMLRLPDERIVEAIQSTLEGHKVVDREVLYKSATADKTTPVRTIFSPIVSAAGVVEGGVGIIEDITERIAAEKLLKDSKERYQSLFEQAADGVLIGTNDGKLIDVNESMTTLSGYAVEELLGRNISILFSDSTLEKLPLDYKAVLAGKTVLKQRALLKKDGSSIIVEIKTRKVGENVLQACLRDITERTRAEQALKTSEDRLKRFFDLNPYSIQVVDRDGFTLSTNKAHFELFGAVPPKEYNVFQDSVMRKNGFLTEMKKTLMGETVHIPEFYYNTREVSKNLPDNPMWLQMVMFPLHDIKHDVEMIVLMHENISEQHILKDRLRHTEKMEAIGQLAGGIAHDFNNMLSGIMGGAFLLQDHVTSENGKKYLKIINDSAQRTSDLTDKLLTFGRKGNTSFSVENIIDAIKNSIEILKYTLDRKVDIEFLYEPDMILVNGNIAQLQNIFINLGINACHAMPNGGKLTFRAKVKPAGAFSMEVGSSHYVKIEVEDTGVGISQKNQQKVFEPFFTTREVNEGSGLGLATVYGSVKDHKGVIRLNSEEGKGTVFYIYLPVVNGNGNDMSVEAQQQAWLEKESGCILLVDDEKMVQDTNRIMLEKIGYTVLTADNGQEGVEVYKKNRHKIDLIILDMIMPKMNGLECFTEIKKISPDVKIIMASGFSSDSDVKKLKESGLISYIRKPFRISELVSVIKTARQGEAN